MAGPSAPSEATLLAVLVVVVILTVAFAIGCCLLVWRDRRAVDKEEHRQRIRQSKLNASPGAMTRHIPTKMVEPTKGSARSRARPKASV
jgi:hypothetical protein